MLQIYEYYGIDSRNYILSSRGRGHPAIAGIWLWWLAWSRHCLSPGSQYDAGAASVTSVVSVMGKSIFFTSQIASLTVNFSTIWLVGRWLTLVTLRWRERNIVNQALCSIKDELTDIHSEERTEMSHPTCACWQRCVHVVAHWVQQKHLLQALQHHLHSILWQSVLNFYC